MLKKILLFTTILLATSQMCFAQMPPQGIQDEGGNIRRPAHVKNCVGDLVACTFQGITGTITVQIPVGTVATLQSTPDQGDIAWATDGDTTSDCCSDAETTRGKTGIEIADNSAPACVGAPQGEG